MKRTPRPELEEYRIAPLSPYATLFHPYPSFIELSERDQACLLEALENPPEPNAALLRAFTRNTEK